MGSAVKGIDSNLAILAISGTALEHAARARHVSVFSEVFADRAYLPNGQLVPRSRPGAVLHDMDEACVRLMSFLKSKRLLPVAYGKSIFSMRDLLHWTLLELP
ncbi:LamB/YcsF family protein [Acidovorax sp. sif0715]|nr:LamB/YcsF family protein [Acidovorax sp. sif0732]MBV7451166.1 LamB/YcsF family protein [Acidovorax sp. sif0715]